jgi:hypothetical protein
MAAFQDLVKAYCNSLDWSIAESNEYMARLMFRLESGREQHVYIIAYNTTIEFSVPSEISFDNEESIPHLVSTVLLMQNAKAKLGAWVIETINNRPVFSIMHNIEMQDLNKDAFERTVQTLVMKCDEFEEMIASASGNPEVRTPNQSNNLGNSIMNNINWGKVIGTGVTALLSVIVGQSIQSHSHHSDYSS